MPNNNNLVSDILNLLNPETVANLNSEDIDNIIEYFQSESIRMDELSGLVKSITSWLNTSGKNSTVNPLWIDSGIQYGGNVQTSQINEWSSISEFE